MSNPLAMVGFAVLAFCLACGSDYLETRYVRAVHQWEEQRSPRTSDRVAGLSILMWGTSVLGLLTIVEAGWWVLIPEGFGLYVGTKLALR